MSYSTNGLFDLVRSSRVSVWLLVTADSLATATGSGYISDASTAGSGKGAAGRGMQLGDIVLVISGADSATAWADLSSAKFTPCFVKTISATTGAGTIAVGAFS